nr:MAG: hypothetical protein [Bacteriophage sp.]
MENISRMVIDLYKQSFTDYVNGNMVNVDAILEAQRTISNAIVKAKIENASTEELERLKTDIDYLKYKIL